MKLTSNGIEWEDGANFAIVSKRDNTVLHQFNSKHLNMPPATLPEHYRVTRGQPKLRLSYFKSIGLKLVNGDKFINNRNAELTVGVDVDEFLANQSDCELSVISHLVKRDASVKRNYLYDIDFLANAQETRDKKDAVNNDTHQQGGDNVKSPKHYQLMDGIESIEVIACSLTKSEWRGFCLGNALKYRIRAGKKDELQQDVDKANFYTDVLFNKHAHLCRNNR